MNEKTKLLYLCTGNSCRFFPGGARVVHIGFDDPPKLVAHDASEEEKLNAFRRVRDEIKAFVETLPYSLV